MDSRQDGVGYETELVKRALSGDKGGLAEIFAMYEQDLYCFCYLMLLDQQAAEAVLKRTFTKVFDEIESLRDSSGFRSWIYKLAKDACVAEVKKENLSNPVRGEGVEKCLKELSVDHRVTVLLIHYARRSYDEVAEIIECPIESVKLQFATALEELTECLKRQGGT